MGFTGCRRKPARTGCACGDSAAIARAVSCGVCIVILAAGGWAVWQRLRRDWQLSCFVRAAGNLTARWLNGKVSQAFSGNTLVYNPTLGDWRTHNGTDYTAEQVTAVAAGTVTAIADDALWGRVVEVTDAQDRVWRYCGLEEVAVTQREKVTAGTRLGTTGNVPAEAQQGSHLHLECRKAGACLDPEKN